MNNFCELESATNKRMDAIVKVMEKLADINYDLTMQNIKLIEEINKLHAENASNVKKLVPDNNEPYKMPAPIKITWDKGDHNHVPYCQKEE